MANFYQPLDSTQTQAQAPKTLNQTTFGNSTSAANAPYQPANVLYCQYRGYGGSSF
jgi:hypothetical protein